MRCIYTIFFISLFAVVKANAQNSVRTKDDSIFNELKAVEPYHTEIGKSYVVVYKTASSCSVKGTQLLRDISPNVAIIILLDSSVNLAENACIEKFSLASDRWKLSPQLQINLAELKRKQNNLVAFTITTKNLDTFLSKLLVKKIKISLINLFREIQSATIKCTFKTFSEEILPLSELFFADILLKPGVDEMVNGYNRSINNINVAEIYFPNANGKGVTIGIKENRMNEDDIDLKKRVLTSPIADNEIQIHASTIATLVGGAGNSFYTGKGAASRCNFFPSSFSNLFPDSSNLLLQKNVTVQNHSYGTQVQSFYGAEAMSYDLQTQRNPLLLHIFSSGNSGTSASASGNYTNLNGFANLTGNFKSAKNIITVAAVDTFYRLAPFSSSGPLYDGRLAPQIAALGPNGTSEAAALISGAAAVLQQVYKDSNTQATPPSSLIKAILFTTCDDIGNKGIDYNSGYGLMNILEALKCLQQRKFDESELQQSQTWTKNISIPSQAANLKITLSWTDTSALVNNSKALVNDLDLELVQLNTGNVYKPWVLNISPNIDSLKKEALRGRDSLNTAEQVSLELPTAGQYQIRVTGKNISTIQKQPFHIAYKWDTLNKVSFTNPVEASDINRKENPILTIKWKAVVADTNALGNLFISFNNGQSWLLIGTNIKVNRQTFSWAIPDTTSAAQLRMDCSFGTFYSDRFLIAPLTELKVDYRCDDSMRLSWQKNALANNYQLFTLGDTAFMKPILLTTDTFAVLRRISFPENVFAVQPILSNGLTAARSIAVDTRNQGVNCFYKTLLAEVRGDSVRILLSLGFGNGIDSIHIEKVSAGGILIKVLSVHFPSANRVSYLSADHSPNAGANFYRAKIWINGRFVYTNIVSVIHNGKSVLLIYPNPIKRGDFFSVMSPESIGENTFQLIAGMGRVVKYDQINSSNSISTAKLASGLYWYRLITTNGHIIARGKIVILAL